MSALTVLMLALAWLLIALCLTCLWLFERAAARARADDAARALGGSMRSTARHRDGGPV